MTDGEGAVRKLKTALNLSGIEVDISGAGGHVPTVERRIQVIKQRVRAYMSHRLPIPLNTIGIGMCGLFCVSRMNNEIPGTRPTGPSPREVLTGARARGSLDIRSSFSDSALTTVPPTDNSPSARVEECIVMLPTGNHTGSVKFLHIKTNEIVTRNEIKILPIPPYVITAMTELAARDGRKFTSRTPLHFGSPTTEGPILIAPPGFYDEDPPRFPRSSTARLVDDLADDDVPTLPTDLGPDLAAADPPPVNLFNIGVNHAGNDDAVAVELPPNQNAGKLGVHLKEYAEQDDIADVVDAPAADAVATDEMSDT
jgi:hypothetical protein